MSSYFNSGYRSRSLSHRSPNNYLDSQGLRASSSYRSYRPRTYSRYDNEQLPGYSGRYGNRDYSHEHDEEVYNYREALGKLRGARIAQGEIDRQRHGGHSGGYGRYYGDYGYGYGRHGGGYGRHGGGGFGHQGYNDDNDYDQHTYSDFPYYQGYDYSRGHHGVFGDDDDDDYDD